MSWLIFVNIPQLSKRPFCVTVEKIVKNNFEKTSQVSHSMRWSNKRFKLSLISRSFFNINTKNLDNQKRDRTRLAQYLNLPVTEGLGDMNGFITYVENRFCFLSFYLPLSDSTVLEDAEIESRTVTTSALTVRPGTTTRLNLIHLSNPVQDLNPYNNKNLNVL